MEANLQSNFNVGFTNMRSDVLVHLTQWQYWWWFWFSLLWAFYYLMILKMVRFRSLKFRPRLATTFRPHGKWGDLIVCIIPVSWCANIITNSNFILRMIEWQSESGLITVRIRGKQWYWVYKFELKTFTDIFTVPKNIGHNKWQISTPNDLQVADDYLHILQLRSQNRWVKTYWEDLTKEISKSKDFHLISPQEQLRFNFFKSCTLPDDENSFKLRVEHKFENWRLNYMANRLISKKGFEKDWPEDWFSSIEKIFEKHNCVIYRDEFENINYDALVRTFGGPEEDPKYLNSFEGSRNLLKSVMTFKTPSGSDREIIDLNSFKDSSYFCFFFNALTLNSVRKHLLPREVAHDLNMFLHDIAVGTIKDEDELSKITIVWDVWTFERFYDSIVRGNFYTSYLESSLDKVKDEEPYFSLFDIVRHADIIDDIDSFNDSEGFHNAESLLSTIGEFEDVSDEKLGLPSSNFNENLFVRLVNKKSNWDESTNSDSITDSFKDFLLNDSLFFSRDSQIKNKNFFFENNDIYDYRFGDSNVKNNFYNYSDFNEFDKLSRKSQGSNSPVRLIKYPVSNKTNFDFNSDVVELFRLRYNDSESTTEHRLTPNSTFLIIRQKRYKRRKVILPRTIFYKDDEGNFTKRPKSSNYTFLSQNKIILENDFNATKRYKFFKKNKIRDELTNLVLSKRILRTRRTLVLPAHLNITAITNSFDVIHSWFIPGLGLKMDAIPGRATHHTFYIDNVGFYYGQCAEICGRYHHHMPIRICALPFEHFLLWWQSFGLPKLLFTKNFRRYSYSYGSRKYAW